jgi:hypothetical protein
MARRPDTSFERIVYEPAAELQPEALRRVYDRLFETTAARVAGPPGSPPARRGGVAAELDSFSLLSHDADTMPIYPHPHGSPGPSRCPAPPHYFSDARSAEEESG